MHGIILEKPFANCCCINSFMIPLAWVLRMSSLQYLCVASSAYHLSSGSTHIISDQSGIRVIDSSGA